MTQEQLDGLKPYQIEACKGHGCVPARFMFIGISAGKLGALQTEVPLTKDGSGRIFQRMLGALKLSESDEFSIRPVLRDCYITNFVKGRILDEKGNNRLPYQCEFDYWAESMYAEICKVQPWRIIALGELVYRYLLDLDAVPSGYRDTAALVKAKHPRWYFSHGGLNPNSKAFKQMVLDYHELLTTK